MLNKMPGTDRKEPGKGLRVAAALMAVLMLLAGPAAADGDACFSANSRPERGLRVYRQAPPPESGNQPGYQYWPLDVAVTGQIDAIARSEVLAIETYAFLWANRCHPVPGRAGTCKCDLKGNFMLPRYVKDGSEVRPFFTGLARANACTLAQTAHLLGEQPSRLMMEAKAAGIGLVRRSDPLDARIEGGRFVDLCILTDDMLPEKARDIMLDYEVQDGRTPAETLAFRAGLARLVRARGKVPMLFTNPLDAPSQRWTGVHPGIGPTLLGLFDKMTILLWHRNRHGDIAASFASQMAVLAGPDGKSPVDPSRLIVVFELANTTQDEARTVHDLMRRSGISDILFWRNYADVGGSCDSDTNRKIACLALGRCR